MAGLPKGNLENGNQNKKTPAYSPTQEVAFHNHDGVSSPKLSKAVLPVQQWYYQEEFTFINQSGTITFNLPIHDYYKVIFCLSNVSSDVMQIYGQLNLNGSVNYNYTIHADTAIGSVSGNNAILIADATPNAASLNQVTAEIVFSGKNPNGHALTFFAAVASNIGDDVLMNGNLKTTDVILTNIAISSATVVNGSIQVFYRDNVAIPNSQ